MDKPMVMPVNIYVVTSLHKIKEMIYIVNSIT